MDIMSNLLLNEYFNQLEKDFQTVCSKLLVTLGGKDLSARKDEEHKGIYRSGGVPEAEEGEGKPALTGVFGLVSSRCIYEMEKSPESVNSFLSTDLLCNLYVHDPVLN
jgi:hypothetical protein